MESRFRYTFNGLALLAICLRKAVRVMADISNYERIKNMSIEELADFLRTVYQHNQEGCFLTYSQVKEYLEREADNG
jgi:hypothetical protein